MAASLDEKLSFLINTIRTKKCEPGESLELELRIGRSNARTKKFESVIDDELIAVALAVINNSSERSVESVNDLYFERRRRVSINESGQCIRAIEKKRLQVIDIPTSCNSVTVRICLSSERQCGMPDNSERYIHERKKKRISAPIGIFDNNCPRHLWRLDITEVTTDSHPPKKNKEIEIEAVDLKTISSYTTPELKNQLFSLLKLLNLPV